MLDTDRDAQLYFRLTVDHRGWAADQCGGCTAWNPEWYIAAAQDQNSWTVEMALPLKELFAGQPKQDVPYLMAIQRLNYNSVDLWSPPQNKLPSPIHGDY